MLKLIFEYNVAVEKQEEYLKATNDTIKPFWESKSCKSYSVWQVAENETGFVKEMLFADKSVMKECMALEEAGPIKEIFFSFAGDISRKTCIQKI